MCEARAIEWLLNGALSVLAIGGAVGLFGWGVLMLTEAFRARREG